MGSTKKAARTKALVGLGDRVRSLRTLKGMTGAALAKHAGVDASSITRVEDGRQMLGIVPLTAVAKALGATADYLLTGDGPPPELAPAAAQDRDRRRRQG